VAGRPESLVSAKIASSPSRLRWRAVSAIVSTIQQRLGIMQPLFRRFSSRRLHSSVGKWRRRRVSCVPCPEPLEGRRLLSAASSRHALATYDLTGERPGSAAAFVRINHVSRGSAAAATASDSILHNFGGTISGVPDGWQPWGSLTPVMTKKGLIIFGRTLYGGASQSNSPNDPTDSGGIIFTFNPTNNTYQIVHSFEGGADDGWQPHHDQLRQAGNVLFGATLMGGSSTGTGLGVVFSIRTSGSDFKVLHAFTGDSGSSDDGALPHSNPMPDASGKMLYGLTSQGGSNDTSKGGDGTIYQLKRNGKDYKVIFSFSESTGTDPHGFVIIHHHTLYGMTRQGGGSTNFGTVFAFNTKTSTFSLLHTFLNGDDDGASPDHGGLVRIGQKLYGVTTNGGPNGQNKSNTAGDGILFSIDTAKNNAFSILHAFGASSTDGVGPHGSLFLYRGKLYGMTSSGGAYGTSSGGYGTIFRIDPSGRKYRVIYSFQGEPSDGTDGLDNVFIAGGRIYGMTKYGGSVEGSANYENGVIFSLPVPK
jgi:uncharacterized repeat protein (TIGR03803 family)